MRITVMGCDASITNQRRTTCYRVDDDVLIDAGTGAGDLTLEQAVAIEHVFLTHAHLDHCCMLPMLSDAAGPARDKPLTVHALPETIAALRQHMFNGTLWPDYTTLPTPARPFLRFSPILPGASISLSGRILTALPAQHSIPCTGYCVDSGTSSLVFSSDTTLYTEFWQTLNRFENLRYLLIENTFRNIDAPAALSAGHMTATLLAKGLHLLLQPVELYIVHMEAGHEQETFDEIVAAIPHHHPRRLQRGHVFEL